MTLLCRDAADILEAQLAFHLNAGVDFVIATDHRSEDGTTEILEQHEREGHLHLIREESEQFEQSRWVTRMARLAATDFGASWVLNSDSDEFWWPRGADLKDVLAAIPDRYGLIRGHWRTFPPRPDDGRFFAERMTVRLAPVAPINDPTTPWRPNAKVIHRAHPQVVVRKGNHSVDGVPLQPLRGWSPVEVLHFPWRSPAHATQKATHFSAETMYHVLGLAHEAQAAGDLDERYDAFVVDDDALERGLADGSLVEDTRVRDALRVLAGTGEVSADVSRATLRRRPRALPRSPSRDPTLSTMSRTPSTSRCTRKRSSCALDGNSTISSSASRARAAPGHRLVRALRRGAASGRRAVTRRHDPALGAAAAIVASIVRVSSRDGALEAPSPDGRGTGAAGRRTAVAATAGGRPHASPSFGLPRAGRTSTCRSCGTTASSCFGSSGATWRCATSRPCSGSPGRSCSRSLTMVVFTIVFGKFANFPSRGVPYPHLHVLGVAAVDVLRVVSGARRARASSSNRTLVTKVYFPRVLLPLAGVTVPIVDFAFAFVVLVRDDDLVPTSWPICGDRARCPRSCCMALVTALGVGLFLSAVNVRYRDVPYTIPFLLQIWLFVSGSRVRDQRAPGAVAVALLTEPDDGRHQRLPLGAPRHAGTRSRADRWSASPSPLRSSSSASRYFRRSEPRFADTI